MTAPLFVQDENILTVRDSSPWDIVGSLQCIATNLAGTMGTSVRILITGMPFILRHTVPCNLTFSILHDADKPNPPVELKVTRRTDFPYQFEINWDDPASIANQTITEYTTEVFIPSYNKVCSCNLHSQESSTSFLAWHYHKPDTKFHFVLASHTNSGESDVVCETQSIGVGMYSTVTH